MAPIKTTTSSNNNHSHNHNVKQTIDSYFPSTNTTKKVTTTTTTRFTSDKMPPIYCDLDGVLADHDAKMIALYGHNWRRSQSYKTNSGTIYDRESNDFFNELPWMKDGERLWQYIKQFKPTILTALPNGGNDKTYDGQKREWCKRELGDDVPVITTKGPWDKWKSCKQNNSILIDDRFGTKKSWVEKGGIFIHHKNSTDTINQLKGMISFVG